MKFTLLTILFALSALGEDAKTRDDSILAGRDKAFSAYFAAIKKADFEYRQAYAKSFQYADRVEVYLLDFSMGKDAIYKPKDDEAAFPISAYSTRTKILKTATVPAKDLAVWRAAIYTMVAATDGGSAAFCHYPIHGLRLFAGDRLLFETSLCWKCGNYSFDYLDVHKMVGLTDDSNDLRKLIHDFLPVPEKEMKRLESQK